MNISNDQWGKYYYIYNCSISDSNVIDNRFAVTTATDSTTATSFTAGWVSNQAKFSFTMENRYTGGPNHLQVMMNNNSVVKYDGKKAGSRLNKDHMIFPLLMMHSKATLSMGKDRLLLNIPMVRKFCFYQRHC